MEELLLRVLEAYEGLLDKTRWFAEELNYRLEEENPGLDSDLREEVLAVMSGFDEHSEVIEGVIAEYRELEDAEQ